MRRDVMLVTMAVLLLAVTTTVFAGGGGEDTSEETVTITMLNLNPESGPAIETLNEAFMAENPDIVIEHQAMNSRQYDQRIQALAAANDLPDIPTTQMFPQYKAMARNGLFQDLSDAPIVQSGMFDEVALTALTIENGEFVYGLTWNNLAVGAFYNREIFAEYDLEIPTNWDEFLEVGQTLLDNGVTPIVSPLGDGWTSMYPVFTAGIHSIYLDNPDYDEELVAGEAEFDNAGWREAFEKNQELYERGFYGENPMGGRYEQSLSDFANGQGAMLIMGTWVIPVFREINPDLEFGMFPVPFNEPGEELRAMFESELGMSIAERSPYREEVLRYFEFFYSEEPYTDYLLTKKGFSAVRGIDVAFDPSVEYITENYAAEGLTFPYMSREWPAGQDALMFRLFQEIMLGQTDISSALGEMDEFFDENR